MDKKQLNEMREDFKETGKLPPHLQKIIDAQEAHRKKMEKLTGYKITEVVVPGLEWMSKISMNEIKTDQQAAQELVKVAKSLVSAEKIEDTLMIKTDQQAAQELVNISELLVGKKEVHGAFKKQWKDKDKDDDGKENEPKPSRLAGGTNKYARMMSCDRLRRTEEGEDFWQEMMNTRKKVSEREFLRKVDISDVLDKDETWEEYSENASRQGDPIKFYKSKDGTYFFQTAGFEFIWLDGVS